MAEECFLLAQPLLPFSCPQQWRKRSSESVAAPGSRTCLAWGPTWLLGGSATSCRASAPPCPAMGLAPACCWDHPISAGPVTQPSGSPIPCLRPRSGSTAFPGAGGQPAQRIPAKAVWTAGGLQVRSSTPLCESTPLLPYPTGAPLALLGDVCPASGCALADSRL